jgi:hypothetical protein
VATIAFLHGRGGFGLVLSATASIAFVLAAATAVITVLVNGTERQRAQAVVPAE